MNVPSSPWKLTFHERVRLRQDVLTNWRLRVFAEVMARALKNHKAGPLVWSGIDQEIRVGYDRDLASIQVWRYRQIKQQVRHGSILAFGFGGRTRGAWKRVYGPDGGSLPAETPAALRPPWCAVAVPSLLRGETAVNATNPIAAMIGVWLHLGDDGLRETEVRSDEELTEALGRMSLPVIDGAMVSPN